MTLYIYRLANQNLIVQTFPSSGDSQNTRHNIENGAYDMMAITLPKPITLTMWCVGGGEHSLVCYFCTSFGVVASISLFIVLLLADGWGFSSEVGCYVTRSGAVQVVRTFTFPKHVLFFVFNNLYCRPGVKKQLYKRYGRVEMVVGEKLVIWCVVVLSCHYIYYQRSVSTGGTT